MQVDSLWYIIKLAGKSSKLGQEKTSTSLCRGKIKIEAMMQANDIYDRIKSKFEVASVEFYADAIVEPYLEVKAVRVKDGCEFLRDDPELAFDYLMCLSGVDYGNGTLGVV